MTTASYEAVWLGVGFLGQGVFTARFLVQWAVSEKKRDCVVPVAFWWISLVGGMTLLAYAVHKQDRVFIVGQSMGLFVYVRNLMLVSKARRREAKRHRRLEAAAAEASRAQRVATHRVDMAGKGAPAGPHGESVADPNHELSQRSRG